MRKVIVFLQELILQSAITTAVFFLIAFFLFISFAKSQLKPDSLFTKPDPQKFTASINKKAEKPEDKLAAKNLKVPDTILSQEEKIYRKFLSAVNVISISFSNPDYGDFNNKILYTENWKTPKIRSKSRQNKMKKNDSVQNSYSGCS